MQDDKQKINKVRLCADSGKFDSPKNDLTNLPISFRAGDSVCFDIVLLHNNKLVDCSNLSTIALEILDVGAPNSPLPRNPRLLVKKIVEASQVQTTLTQEEFESGGKHLSILLNSSDTALKQKYYYLKLCAFDEYGNRATFASGWILVEQVYGSEIITDKEQINFIEELEGIVNRQIARVDETLEQFDVLKCELENKADKSSTLLGYGINDTYTKAEADLKISTATQALQLFKSNSGALHCGEHYCWFGKSSTTAQSTANITKSVLFRIVDYDWHKNPTDPTTITTLAQVGGYGGYNGMVLNYYRNRINLQSSYNSSEGRYTLFEISYNKFSQFLKNSVNDFFVVFKTDANSTIVDARLYLNGNLVGSVANTGVAWYQNLDAFRFNGGNIEAFTYKDVCVFNFDVSDANAPYTLSDYQQGKPIPPLLLKGTQKVLDNNYQNWAIYNSSSFDLSKDSNADTLTATCIASNSYLTFSDDWKSGLKAGDVVSVSWDSIVLPAGINILNTAIYANDGTSSRVYTIANGSTFINAGDSSYIYFRIGFTANVAVGDTITVKGLRIRVNGALLALENYTITNGTTKQIFDYSGNANDATCSGSVKGDNDNRVQRLVDFIKA